MGGSTKDWQSIVLTRSEHQAFANAWAVSCHVIEPVAVT